MRLFTDDDFPFIHMNKHTAQLSSQYYEKGCVQLLDVQIDETRHKRNRYHVTGIVEVGSHINELHVDIVKSSYDLTFVSTFDCDCPWCQYGSMCAHIGAVLHMITQIDFASFPYHFQKTTKTLQEYLANKEEKRRLQEELAHKRMLESKARESYYFINDSKNKYVEYIQSLTDTKIYMVKPSFEFASNCVYISFQVGNEKMYSIRRYSDFVDWVHEKRVHQYGKNLTFKHDINHFSELSKKWIQFMEYTIKVLNYNRYSYYGNDTGKYLIVDKDNIAMFYQMFHEEEVYKDLFEEQVFTYPISIEKEGEYYKIASMVTNQEELFCGTDGFYSIGTNKIIFYPIQTADILNEFISSLQYNEMIIREEEYANFEHYVLGPNQPYLDIEYKENVLLPARSALANVKVYGDLADEMTIVFHATGYNESNELTEIIGNDMVLPNFQIDLIRQFLELHADYLDGNYVYYNLENPHAIELIQEGTQQLALYCDVLVSEELKKLGKKTKYSIQAGVTFQNNLLEINLETLDFDVDEVPSILSAYHRKKKYYRLKNGLVIHLESDELSELDDMMNDYHLKASDIKNGKIQLESYRLLGLDKNLDSFRHIEVQKDEAIVKYVEGFEKQRNQYKIDSQYKNVLRPYQKRGVKWLFTLYQYNFNGILADDMGLGKTIQVIALLDSIKDDSKHSLVVCPSSLIYNWEDEIKRFSTTLQCLSVMGSKADRKRSIALYKEYDVLVTSYDYIRRDVDLYMDCEFEYVILDEAQYIKNQKTMNAQSVKSLKSKHRLALSGTPIENSLAELWSIFDFLMPGYLYTYHNFKMEYETPIVVEENKNVSAKLKNLISPFILRRTKSQVLKELPDKVNHQYLLDFSEAEKKLYLANLATVNKEMQANMKEENFDRMKVLAMLTRLRQLCLDPRLIYDNVKTPSTKIKATIDLIKVLVENKKKILLFSAFTSLLDLIQESLNKEGISYYCLTGSTSKEERRKLVNAFQNDDTDVFLISLKAGGTGLNLTAAEVVIHIDPWWNLSAQNQATDRAHRIGQNANVQVYSMIMKDSIEEKILKMQERKANLANDFVEGNHGTLSKMSKEDIMDLFQR